MIVPLYIRARVKYVTMLFTVDTKLPQPPQAVYLGVVDVGYCVETQPFIPTAEDFNWPGEIPLDQQGRPILPGRPEMDMLQRYFDLCVSPVNCRAVDLGYRNFQWPGHITMDKPIVCRYTVTRVKARLGCWDMTWQAELVNGDGHPAVCYTFTQRWYHPG